MNFRVAALSGVDLSLPFHELHEKSHVYSQKTICVKSDL